MKVWGETNVYEFLTTDGERHVFVLAESLEKAADMCGLSVEQQWGYHRAEVFISEMAFTKRNVPDREDDAE